MRCLYCGKQLALLRRLTGGGEFCSEAHKQSYHDEYNRLALSRLLQAQSKPEEARLPAPRQDHLPALANPAALARATATRDLETGWTTTAPAGQKRLSAVPTAPVQPGRATFLIDKPVIRAVNPLERPAQAPTPKVAIQEPVHPSLTCGLAAYEPASPGPVMPGLARLPRVPVLWPASPDRAGLEGAVRISTTPEISTVLPLPFSQQPRLMRAGLVSFDIKPMAPDKEQPEPEQALAFTFPIVLKLDDELGNAETDEPERLQSPIHLKPVAARNLEPAWPTGSLRIMMRGPAVMDDESTSRQSIVSLRLATRGDSLVSLDQQERDAPQERVIGNEGTPSVDLPTFLTESRVREKSVWGSVQKYLKNIVSCLLLTSLGGGVYWHFHAAPKFGAAVEPVANAHIMEVAGEVAGPAYGEADRIRPKNQIFIYPASMLLPDYQVEFELPIMPVGIEWTFRMMDPGNHYAMRLESAPGGAGYQVQKYLVVAGEHVQSEAFKLPNGPKNGGYRIMLRVKETQFETYAQGRLVDRWSDSRFARGGFGYYASPSNTSPIKSVRIADVGDDPKPQPNRRG